MIENEQAVTNQETKKIKLTKSAIENQEKLQNSEFTRTTKVRKTRKKRAKTKIEKLQSEFKKKKKQNRDQEEELEGKSLDSTPLKEGDKFLIDDKDKVELIKESQQKYYEKILMEFDENNDENDSKREKDKEIMDKIGEGLAGFGLDQKAIKRSIKNRSVKKEEKKKLN